MIDHRLNVAKGSISIISVSLNVLTNDFLGLILIDSILR